MAVQIPLQTNQTTEMIDITGKVQDEVGRTGIKNGLVVVYVSHTTAGVTINEGADPSVRTDIIETLNEIVPFKRAYRHMEGNSPAHIKATLVGSSETILLEDGHLRLGRWQHVFFCEFDGPRRRSVLVKVLPE
ncbi:MAG: YjbQ family protein [Deltaproteobacteria bacterium]|nr:YjbQ family protein [Deltaproteobacteria bacterium]MBW2050973.1 YjbQ family protein [Deltaproteobacteria bacterium]MBW2141864.1 YjbQ family protein [Deltaproteobacteria bacterium]MBW2322245.1 YjbQ family protein [Deltaproteobacteria bacterium]